MAILFQHQTIWQRARPDLGVCTAAPGLKGANNNSKRFELTTREIGRGHEEIGSCALALQYPFSNSRAGFLQLLVTPFLGA